jgi:hypothetical protein
MKRIRPEESSSHRNVDGLVVRREFEGLELGFGPIAVGLGLIDG